MSIRCFPNRAAFPRNNRGAVLFIALIMLLLLTLLGVTAMQVTLLQERMAGNFRVQQQAFEGAEGLMAAGRDQVADPLWAYDHIPDVPVRLESNNKPYWTDWLTSAPAPEFKQDVLHCGGACPERRGSGIGDDPNKKPRFYVISGQEKDPLSTDENAAWATVQTIYVF